LLRWIRLCLLEPGLGTWPIHYTDEWIWCIVRMTTDSENAKCY